MTSVVFRGDYQAISKKYGLPSSNEKKGKTYICKWIFKDGEIGLHFGESKEKGKAVLALYYIYHPNFTVSGTVGTEDGTII